MSDAQHTAFVAGATGYTGSALVAELRRRNIRTVAHVRPDSSRLGEWRARFEALGADVDTTPWDESAMITTLAALQPDAVFALLGTTRSRSKRTDGRDTYETVDYGLTSLLLRAAADAVPRARFIYLSSIGADAPRGEYLRARWRVEQELQQSELSWTIVRPSFITGSDREEIRHAERLGALLADALLDVAGAVGARTLHDRYSSLTATQLAIALARHAFETPSANCILEGEDLRS